MPTLNLAGVSVDFPKEPYDVQKKFMTCAINALQSKQNALLESPTGTGKTLCLLCAALAWQQHELKEAWKEERSRGPNSSMGSKLEYNDGANITAEQQRTMISRSLKFDDPSTGSSGGNVASAVEKPKSLVIIYASRTHTQLKQVVRELRSTSYLPEMTILGSRDQLCINKRMTSKFKGTQLVHACNRATATHSCRYKNNLDNLSSKQNRGHRSNWLDGLDKAMRMLDIEDLVNRAEYDEVCPYFHTRGSSEESRLLLMPYNYLLEASIRKTLNVTWEGAIVIFDEAHNLEQVACDAVSVSLTSAEIGACIEELQQTLRELRSLEDTEKVSGSAVDSKGGSLDSRRPEKAYVATLLKRVFALQDRLDAVPLSQYNPGPTDSNVMAGPWMDKTLQEVGFQSHLKGYEIENIKAIIEFLMSLAQEKTSTTGGNGATVTTPKLESLLRLVEKALSEPRQRRGHGEDYKVFICRDEEDRKSSGQSYKGYQNSAATNQKNNKWILNYWGFSPGIALQELRELGVRQVLLASGTLSPMAAFRADLKLPFPIELQNPHVISLKKQVWVGALGAGPTGKQLSSAYEIRETEAYKDELGASLVLILQTMLGRGGAGGVPGGPKLDGGVLVFFVSYGVMSNVEARWRHTGLWDTLVHLGGSVIVEPSAADGKSKTKANDVKRKPNASLPGKRLDSPLRKGGGMSKTMGSNASTGEMNAEEEDDGVKSFMQQFEIAVKTHGRCLLLAVCRGKASEGIDFSDSKGRVAVMTGIPYRPPQDAWVTLKRQYMDENCALSTSTVPQTVPDQSIGGWAAAVQSTAAAQSTGKAPMAPPPTRSELTEQSISLTKARGNELARVPTLSGEQWYRQDACRAVNQALGRIIRHRGDWGAIFLLDSRFNQAKQKAELSHWIRPVHKSFSGFQEALASFREFSTAAMANPDLVPSIPEPVVTVAPTLKNPVDPEYLQQLNKRLDPKWQAGEVATMQAPVFLPESAVAHEVGSSYIPPNVLAQATHKRPEFPSVPASVFRPTQKDILDEDFSQIPVKDSGTKSLQTSAKRPSLFSKGPKAKVPEASRPETSDPSNGVDDLAHLKKSFTTTSAPLINKDLFADSETTSGLGISRVAPKRLGGLTLGGFSGAIQLVPKSQQASKSAPSSSNAAAASSEISLPPESATVVSTENLTKDQKKNLMATALTAVGKSLSKEYFDVLKDLVLAARKSGLTVEKECDNFINEVLKVMLDGSSLKSNDFQALLLDLQYLIKEPSIVPYYIASVKKKCADQAKSDAAKRQRPPATLSEIGELSMPMPSDAPGGKRSKMLCPICQDHAMNLCAARCGHICCKSCWSTCLRAKRECPLCKQPAEAENLTPIVLIPGV